MTSRTKLVGIALFVGLVSACSAPPEQKAQEPDELARLDSSAVAEIKGNVGHNLLAKSDRLERGMSLAAAVKGVTGKKFCSPKRTMYRGADRGDSYWSIECHDGSTFQVQIKMDGDGAVMDCADPKSVGIDIDCWQKFDEKSK